MPTESLPFEGAAFDALAADYDVSFTTTRLGSELRAMVWKRLDAGLPAHGRIAEIGCGTGEDAVHLAQRGYTVLAIDASEKMLEIAFQKARQAGCESSIEFAQIPIQQLASRLDGARFDAVFSNFGVFNCAGETDVLALELANLLKPGAPLIAVIMARYVPWEWAWFLMRLDWRKAFRRLPRRGTIWRGMRIRYPTPSEFAKSLGPGFENIRAYPLGLVLPPSYASDWLNRHPRAFDVLASLERALHRFQSLSGVADHYIVEAQRQRLQLDD